jgi:hypothetical protein
MSNYIKLEKILNECLNNFQSSLCEIIETCEYDPEVFADALEKSKKEAITYFGLFSSVSKQYYDCDLPKQPNHGFTIGSICISNNHHKFCKCHSLTKCPICGEGLAELK